MGTVRSMVVTHTVIMREMAPGANGFFYTRVLFAMSYIITVLNIIPTLYEGYLASVHRMVIENRPVDPGRIQGSHRPTSFMRTKYTTRANDLP